MVFCGLVEVELTVDVRLVLVREGGLEDEGGADGDTPAKSNVSGPAHTFLVNIAPYALLDSVIYISICPREFFLPHMRENWVLHCCAMAQKATIAADASTTSHA
jgi:hypothetical protein